MDPWQPVNSKISAGDVTEIAPVTFSGIFPQLHERKSLDSVQYLSIIGMLKGAML